MSLTAALENASLVARTQRIDARRFLSRPELPTHWGELGENDSLVARMEATWGMRPTVIEVSLNYEHPHDENVATTETRALPRNSAAQVLRNARREGLLIERHRTGYSISGAFNPAWRQQA